MRINRSEETSKYSEGSTRWNTVVKCRTFLETCLIVLCSTLSVGWNQTGMLELRRGFLLEGLTRVLILATTSD